eukprot:SM000145S00818  [mRNA]  locus=s145:381534:383400:+ [translate_table: standard]
MRFATDFQEATGSDLPADLASLQGDASKAVGRVEDYISQAVDLQRGSATNVAPVNAACETDQGTLLQQGINNKLQLSLINDLHAVFDQSVQATFDVLGSQQTVTNLMQQGLRWQHVLDDRAAHHGVVLQQFEEARRAAYAVTAERSRARDLARFQIGVPLIIKMIDYCQLLHYIFPNYGPIVDRPLCGLVVNGRFNLKYGTATTLAAADQASVDRPSSNWHIDAAGVSHVQSYHPTDRDTTYAYSPSFSCHSCRDPERDATCPVSAAGVADLCRHEGYAPWRDGEEYLPTPFTQWEIKLDNRFGCATLDIVTDILLSMDLYGVDEDGATVPQALLTDDATYPDTLVAKPYEYFPRLCQDSAFLASGHASARSSLCMRVQICSDSSFATRLATTVACQAASGVTSTLVAVADGQRSLGGGARPGNTLLGGGQPRQQPANCAHGHLLRRADAGTIHGCDVR